MAESGLAKTQRRGAVAVFTVVMLVVILGFGALAIDSGYLYNVHGEVQTAADAAALAGASAFFEEDVDVTDVRPRAAETARMNYAAQKPVRLPDERIQIGFWNYMEQSFTPLSGMDEEDGNAVRVVAPRHDLNYFFAPILGVNRFNVDREAIAHRVPPCGGIFGLQSVEIGGTVRTDSYESGEGFYSAAYAGEKGDICSNGPINVGGTAEVHGDASPGPGYNVDIIGNAEVTGATTPSTEPFVFPPVELAEVMLNNDNATIGPSDLGRPAFRGGPADLYVSGGPDNLTLLPGTYFFTSMQILSQAKVTVVGPTTIYVSGDVRMGGGAIVNATEDPKNLTINSTGETLELHGGTGFYGSVYAPNTDIILLGDSAYYGSIVGNTIDIGGTAEIHVDQSLDLVFRPASPPYLVK